MFNGEISRSLSFRELKFNISCALKFRCWCFQMQKGSTPCLEFNVRFETGLTRRFWSAEDPIVAFHFIKGRVPDHSLFLYFLFICCPFGFLCLLNCDRSWCDQQLSEVLGFVQRKSKRKQRFCVIHASYCWLHILFRCVIYLRMCRLWSGSKWGTALPNLTVWWLKLLCTICSNWKHHFVHLRQRWTKKITSHMFVN